MSADYESTARALALPIDEPSPERRSSSPVWHRRSGSYGRHSSFSSRPLGYKDRITQNAEKLQRQYMSIYNKLSPIQRALLVVAGVITLVLGILFLVFNEKIFAWLAPAAQKWRDVPAGWLILWAAVFLVSFPPLIGYSSCVTVAGFVYGFPNGWFIVASATIIGSTCSFVVSRTVLSSYVERLIANDKRFAALSLTLKQDGIKLLCMIRLCPLPYSLSNGAIATFPTVTWVNFAIATALVSPKLLIHVFVGSRIAALANDGSTMDAKTRTINYLSIIFGIVIGVATGWIIYRQTKARAAQLEAEEIENAPRRSSSSIGEYSDDPIEYEAHNALRRDDDISLHEQENDEYRDVSSDDEGNDVFHLGDGDEEAAR